MTEDLVSDVEADAVTENKDLDKSTLSGLDLLKEAELAAHSDYGPDCPVTARVAEEAHDREKKATG